MSQPNSWAPVEDMVLPQGATWTKDYLVRDQTGAVVDVSGATVTMMFRGTYAAAAPLVTCTGSVVSGPAGQVRCVAAAVDTAAVRRARGFYDGKCLVGGVTYRFVEGEWKLSRQATY